VYAWGRFDVKIARYTVLGASERSPRGPLDNSTIITPLAIIGARFASSMGPHGRTYYNIAVRHNIESCAGSAMMERA
jgi:hypothetical protein